MADESTTRISVMILPRSQAIQELGYDPDEVQKEPPSNQELSDELNALKCEATGFSTIVGPIVVDDDHFKALEEEGVLDREGWQ